MEGWSPEQWLAIITGVISALGAMIVSIINAIQNKHIERQNEELKQGQLDHEQKAQARSARLLNEPPPAPYDPKRNFPLP